MIGESQLSIIDNDKKVCVRDHINSYDIRNLALGESIAIVIPEYFPRHVCQRVSNEMCHHPLFGAYHDKGHAPDVADVGRVGVSFFEACKDPIMLKRYYREALNMTQALRQVFAPYHNPIDLIRLHLQEVWPAGANLESIFGQKMFIGLCRTAAPGIEFKPHQDIFQHDAPESMVASSLLGQIASNVYLHMDQHGGELELWDCDVDEKHYEMIKVANSYAMDRMHLPEPSAIIKADVGDLVMFNSRRPHAVQPSGKTYRMSVSCFIGYRGEHMPLTYWS